MKFVGKEYDNEIQKENILNQLDIFEYEKLIFLNKMYSNENTLKFNWKIYSTHIHPFEVSKNKDLMYFDSLELEGIIKSRVSYSEDIKIGILNFMRQYFKFRVNLGDIVTDPCAVIDTKDVIPINKKLQSKKILSLDEFYEVLRKSETYSKLYLATPLLLSRYGIKGKKLEWMRKMKWEHLDRKKKVVHIYNYESGQIITELPVDDRFIEWIDKTKITDQLDFGYVLKQTRNVEGVTYVPNQSSVHSRNDKLTDDLKMQDNSFRKISFNDLKKSRIIEFMLRIRQERKLISYDLERICEVLFGEVSTQIMERMKKLYKSVGGDGIATKTSGLHTLEDDNSFEFANNIASKYNINLEEIPLVVEM